MTGLIEFFRENCKAACEQTGEKLISKETLQHLAEDMGYADEDIVAVLDRLPAMVNAKYFPR